MSKRVPEHFCILPWVHVHLNHSGKVFPCCRIDQSFEYGSLHQKSVQDIWNEQPIREMRRALLAGEKPPQCADCYELEALGAISTRMSMNEKFADEFSRLSATQQDGGLTDHPPSFVDLRFSNLCNLRCRTCEPANSTSWYAEAEAVYGSAAPSEMVRLVNDSGALESVLDELIPHLKVVHFLGGEPLIQEEHYRFLDKLIAAGRTDLELRYNTNFSRLSFKNNSALKYWQEFSNVCVSVSLDGIDEQLELLRKGLRAADVERNFQLIRLFGSHLRFKVFPAVSVMNCFHLTAAITRWIESGFIQKAGMLELNYVKSPSFYCVKILNPNERSRLKRHYQEFFEQFEPRVERALFESIRTELTRFLEWAGDEYWPDERPRFLQAVRALDQSRGERFFTLFPELRSIEENP